MWYIFNNGACISSCDSEPNLEDLALRNECAIESTELHEIDKIVLLEGIIQPKPEYIPSQTELDAIFNANIKMQIIAIESKQARAVREVLLNYVGAVQRLQDIEDSIAVLRGQLR